jgi:hypothetical protein
MTMTMKMTNKSKANGRGEGRLREVIRKELGSENNRRFLSRIPTFRPDADTPDALLSLLGDLDRAERDRSAR